MHVDIQCSTLQIDYTLNVFDMCSKQRKEIELILLVTTL